MARSRVSGSGARTAALLVAVLAIVAALGATAAPSNQRAAIDTSCGATVCAAGCCLNGQCLEAYPLACRLVAAVNWMQGTVDALKINDNVAPADVGAACSIGSMCKSGCCQGGTCSAASACAGATGTTKTTAAPATKTVGPSPTGANSTIPPEYLSTDFPMGVRLIDQDHWCLMVPDNDSKHIGEMEQNAHVRCSPAMVALSGGKLPAMNKGVIVTTHFSTGKSEDGKDTWVQMGGGFNGAAVPLAAGDTGGQFDSHGMADPAQPTLLGSPRGSTCLGYDSYVEMLGPIYKNYCIRCCNGPNFEKYCNWKLSGDSCETVFPGIQIDPRE